MTVPDEAVALCLAGRISPAVALARLVLAGMTAQEIGALLPAGSEIAALHARHAGGLEAMAAMLRDSAVDHADCSLDAIRRSFERAVRASPEASVAAYSLGDPALLACATDEVVAWLLETRLIGPETDTLDVGCGIGRVAAAMAPSVRSVTAVDVASGMIDEARRRHGGSANVSFILTDGRSLPARGRSMDLVLFVDSMPYLVQAGIAEAQVSEVARILRPGGALAVLNLSYAGDDDRRAADWADRFGLSLTVRGERPFRLWDGAAYVFRSRR